MKKKEIGERLRNLRGSRKQEEVALAVDISVSALTKYERGDRIPGDEVKLRLAQYYGKTVQEIFFA